ncbi:hypothetical protein NPIL_397261 [Nephila pilipes]|uniref:Uncharacterized protein n=1 Tax=Nephila pilipes TaxID=299642 RepID=A0A8X6U2B9_NEPPI|nr:hypothetical protein NPIL_397261 [Nephila pilipes]
MFFATSMASELAPASVILCIVDPGQKSVDRRDDLIPILGKAVKKIVYERKNTTMQTDSENKWGRRREGSTTKQHGVSTERISKALST